MVQEYVFVRIKSPRHPVSLSRQWSTDREQHSGMEHTSLIDKINKYERVTTEVSSYETKPTKRFLSTQISFHDTITGKNLVLKLTMTDSRSPPSVFYRLSSELGSRSVHPIRTFGKDTNLESGREGIGE